MRDLHYNMRRSRDMACIGTDRATEQHHTEQSRYLKSTRQPSASSCHALASSRHSDGRDSTCSDLPYPGHRPLNFLHLDLLCRLVRLVAGWRHRLGLVCCFVHGYRHDGREFDPCGAERRDAIISDINTFNSQRRTNVTVHEPGPIFQPFIIPTYEQKAKGIREHNMSVFLAATYA